VRAVDQAEVDDVDAELGVDDVLHRLDDLVLGRQARCVGRRRRVEHLRAFSVARCRCGGLGLLGRILCSRLVDCLDDCVLPRHPAQQRALHARRVPRDAGERDAVLEHVLVRLHVPRLCMSSRKSSCLLIASSTVLPMTRSVITDVDAWLIEQPAPS
jgi:hypothetical protein